MLCREKVLHAGFFFLQSLRILFLSFGWLLLREIRHIKPYMKG